MVLLLFLLGCAAPLAGVDTAACVEAPGALCELLARAVPADPPRGPRVGLSWGCGGLDGPPEVVVLRDGRVIRVDPDPAAAAALSRCVDAGCDRVRARSVLHDARGRPGVRGEVARAERDGLGFHLVATPGEACTQLSVFPDLPVRF